ncbi:hypothetical protein CPB83DRAFT_863990, partial [Crepidotus variabilis]
MPENAPFNCALLAAVIVLSQRLVLRNMNSSCYPYSLFILLHRCFRSCWEESMLTSGKSLHSVRIKLTGKLFY